MGNKKSLFDSFVILNEALVCYYMDAVEIFRFCH